MKLLVSIIVFCAQYLYLLVVLAVVLVWAKGAKGYRLKLLATIVLACAIALALSRLAGKVYYDPRPFVTEHIKPLIPHVPDNGFPSDHALLTATLTGVVYFFNKRIALGMLLLTVAVGAARIAAQVHTPLDIAGGWLLGIAGACLGHYLVARYWQRAK